jgi:DNA-directed RNA polymerase specialized sigma24 family protein
MAFISGPPPTEGGSLLPTMADADLVASLQRQGFTGPLWMLARATAARSCIGLLHKMILDGDVAAASKKLGRPVTLSPEEHAALRDRPAREDLVHRAVVAGLIAYRRSTEAGQGWREDGGASLRSYLGNACLRELANAVRPWRTERQRNGDHVPLPEADRSHPLLPDVAVALEEADDLASLLESMPPDLARAARIWLDTGWPWVRIASEMGITSRSLEGLLRRWRQNHRHRSPRPMPPPANPRPDKEDSP